MFSSGCGRFGDGTQEYKLAQRGIQLLTSTLFHCTSLAFSTAKDFSGSSLSLSLPSLFFCRHHCSYAKIIQQVQCLCNLPNGKQLASKIKGLFRHPKSSASLCRHSCTGLWLARMEGIDTLKFTGIKKHIRGAAVITADAQPLPAESRKSAGGTATEQAGCHRSRRQAGVFLFFACFSVLYTPLPL